jgi:GNAT superfamily N-acetyltransferase
MRAQEFVTERKKSREDFEGITIEMVENGHVLVINALDDWGNNVLGSVAFNIHDNNELDPQDLKVDERYQGQGIARAMYDYAKSKGYKIHRSYDQTDAGAGFWNKHRGEDVRVWESPNQSVAERKKSRRKKSSQHGGYFFPGYGYYGVGGDGGDSGGDGGGESRSGMAEGESNDTAISLSKLGKFHPGEDTLAKFVPKRATARYALHPDKWESTFYSLTNKDSDKLKYYGPKKISIPPGTLVGDMAIANKFYRAKTPEEQEQYAELYKASLQPYPVDVSQYRMPELLIPQQAVEEQQLDELSFLGSECTKDCSGHRAGYDWSKRKGLRQANSWSPSFNKGAGLAVAGK